MQLFSSVMMMFVWSHLDRLHVRAVLAYIIHLTRLGFCWLSHPYHNSEEARSFTSPNRLRYLCQQRAQRQTKKKQLYISSWVCTSSVTVHQWSSFKILMTVYVLNIDTPSFKKFGFGQINFFLKKLKVSSAHQTCIYLIWSKISNIVKYFFCIWKHFFSICICLKCNLFLWSKLNLQLQSSVSHDPFEIILICRFAAQKTFLIIIIKQ